jgi:protein tyrosine phosphatase (PTP) superfamily phosphohydrolase (DUF442 family)
MCTSLRGPARPFLAEVESIEPMTDKAVVSGIDRPPPLLSGRYGAGPGRARRVAGLRLWIVVAVGLASVVALTECRRALSYPNEKAALDGVANFGRVSARLYRGAQPSPRGFVSLRQLGVNTVVSFTLRTKASDEEAHEVEALGMEYVSIPWSAEHEPTSAQVAQYLALLREHPDRTIFLHCWQGADRTGVMVALYRIALDHWPVSQAIDEMKAFRYHFIFQPHLQRYVERFAAAPAHFFSPDQPSASRKVLPPFAEGADGGAVPDRRHPS